MVDQRNYKLIETDDMGNELRAIESFCLPHGAEIELGYKEADGKIKKQIISTEIKSSHHRSSHTSRQHATDLLLEKTYRNLYNLEQTHDGSEAHQHLVLQVQNELLALQQHEADEWEQAYLKELSYDPEQVKQLVAKAQHLLNEQI